MSNERGNDGEPPGNDQLEELTQVSSESAALSQSTSLVGRVFGGRFRILRPLARGGMGVVYLAEQIQLRRTVVFKVLPYELAADEKAVFRFEREAHGLSALEHPNIVGVYDYGFDQGVAYIVMEYVDGETLAARLKSVGKMPFSMFVTVAMQTLEALAAAHEHGIIHRDIKPSNIMLCSRYGRHDVVKVLDFGLARELSSSHDVTQGRLVGTISYLAPEVITGERATERSDVYALGVMFYQLVSGVRPFQGADEMSILYQHVNAPPARLEDLDLAGEIPIEVIDAIHMCLAKNPEDRPKNARAVQHLLGGSVSWPSMSSWTMEQTPSPRHMTPAQPRSAISAMVVRSEPEPEIPAKNPTRAWLVGAITFIGVFTVFLSLAAVVNMNAPREKVANIAPEKIPVAVVPVETVSRLEVKSKTAAEVTLDGIVIGDTPIEVNLEPGRHLLSIAAPNREVWEQWIEVGENMTKVIEVSLASQILAPAGKKQSVAPRQASKSTARVTTKATRTAKIAEEPRPEVVEVLPSDSEVKRKPMFAPDLQKKRAPGLLPMK